MLRLLAVGMFTAVLCVACGGGADPGSPQSPSSAASVPSVESPAVSSDLAGYKARQRVAYEAAVAAYSAFVKRNDRFYAVGKTTVAAKNFYQRYAISWATAWGNLAQTANNDVTVSGPTTTVWTKPMSIGLGKSNGDKITIKRCLDESKRVVRQNGKVVAQPQLKTPHIYVVRLQKRSGESWWRSGEPKQGATC